MFLAIKEIRKEKLRSSLIVAMIVLISYLIFILTSLALGLAQQNTDAIDSWHVKTVVLNANANVDMRQSLLTTDQVGALPKDAAVVGQASVAVKAKGHEQVSATFLGLKASQFIAKNLTVTSGRKPTKASEVLADDSLKLKGYKLGSTITLNGLAKHYTIVGFTSGAKMNIAPVLYGTMSAWQTLKGGMPNLSASAVVAQSDTFKLGTSGTKAYSTAAFIQKLPGYSAQNMTFELTIGFLMVISLIIIAVFMYILTMQKLPNYAVLRVQGVPSRVLVQATLAQSLLLVAAGLVGGTVLLIITAAAMPAVVPMAFSLPLLSAVGVGLLAMGLIGGLIPVRRVVKVDPLTVIGG